MARDRKEIIGEMLAAMPETYDKTVGSPFYETQMPTAIELEALEAREDNILKNAFFATADEAHKELIAKDRANISRKEAVASTGTVKIEGVPGTLINKGYKVASDTVLFTIMEDAAVSADGVVFVKVQCDVKGTVGNIPIGAIKDFPVTISGLNTVANVSAFKGGCDRESIADFENRYYDKIRNPVVSGNEAQYRQWAMEVPGVGGAKVKGRTPSRGSVTVTIIDASKTAASSELCETVFGYIEDRRMIGADVYVVSAEELPISLSLNIISEDSTKDYTTLIKEKMREWLGEQAFRAEYISYAKTVNKILEVGGVVDIRDLTINGKKSNVQIGYSQVAVIGEVCVET